MKLGLLGLLVALWCDILPAQTPQVLTARVGPPVIQELMGGCSLVCAFPWMASCGDSKVAAINDNDAGTAWMAIHPGDKLVIRFPKDLPRDLDGTPFYGIDFANGRIHPLTEFKAYGRVKTVRLSRNGEPLYLIRLADTPRWQKVGFPDVLLNVDDTLTIEVVDIYPGQTQPVAAMTEIVLQGAH